MFLKDLAKTILRGERYINGFSPSDLEKQLQVAVNNSSSEKISSGNWFHVKLIARAQRVLTEDWSKSKEFVAMVVFKIKERLSYQELFFLYDRVETLEQS